MVLLTYAVDPETLANFVRLTNEREIPPELPEAELPDSIAISANDNFGNIRQKAFRALQQFLRSEPVEVEPGKWLWKETVLLPIIALNVQDYHSALRYMADVIKKLGITAVRGYWFKPGQWNGHRRLWLPPYWFTDQWPTSLIHGYFEEGYKEWEIRPFRRRKKGADADVAEEDKVADD